MASIAGTNVARDCHHRLFIYAICRRGTVRTENPSQLRKALSAVHADAVMRCSAILEEEWSEVNQTEIDRLIAFMSLLQARAEELAKWDRIDKIYFASRPIVIHTQQPGTSEHASRSRKSRLINHQAPKQPQPNIDWPIDRPSYHAAPEHTRRWKSWVHSVDEQFPLSEQLPVVEMEPHQTPGHLMVDEINRRANTLCNWGYSFMPLQQMRRNRRRYEGFRASR